MAESGSNPNPDKDPFSALHFRSDEPPSDLRYQVLVVEDNESDVFLIEEAMSATKLPIAACVVKDGDQAVRFLDRIDSDPSLSCPALVILDINLPKRQGGDVLKHMRKSRKSKSTPVIAVSTSDSAADRAEMTNLGASGYFHKPSSYDEFMKLGEIVKTVLESAGKTT